MTELFARHTSVISFPEDNLAKHQWIFIKLGMCVDIVQIWNGIDNEQISSDFDTELSARYTHVFLFLDENLS